MWIPSIPMVQVSGDRHRMWGKSVEKVDSSLETFFFFFTLNDTDISAAKYNLWLVNYSNSTKHNVDASQGMVIFLLKNV